MNAVAIEEEIVAQAREILDQYEEPGIEARETEAVAAVQDILSEV